MITHDLQKIVVESSGFYLSGQELYGLVLARVLCPADLFYPFLMLRNQNSGKVSLPVCRVCFELEESAKCTHSIRLVNMQRSRFVSIRSTLSTF